MNYNSNLLYKLHTFGVSILSHLLSSPDNPILILLVVLFTLAIVGQSCCKWKQKLVRFHWNAKSKTHRSKHSQIGLNSFTLNRSKLKFSRFSTIISTIAIIKPKETKIKKQTPANDRLVATQRISLPADHSGSTRLALQLNKEIEIKVLKFDKSNFGYGKALGNFEIICEKKTAKCNRKI